MIQLSVASVALPTLVGQQWLSDKVNDARAATDRVLHIVYAFHIHILGRWEKFGDWAATQAGTDLQLRCPGGLGGVACALAGCGAVAHDAVAARQRALQDVLRGIEHVLSLSALSPKP